MHAPRKLYRCICPGAALLILCAAAAMGAPGGAPSASPERWAALAEPVFHHVARDHGMPNSAVPMSLTQDAEGFIWVGTQNGLARWDGYRFRIYKSAPRAHSATHSASEGALPLNYIAGLLSDKSGALWIATNSTGLLRYDRARDDFVTYPTGPGGISGVSVTSIAADGSGGVWVATRGGVDHVTATGRISHLGGHEDRNPSSLPDSDCYAVLQTRDGALWVGTTTGLVRRAPGTNAFVPVPLPAPDGQPVVVWTLLEGAQGRLWIGTRHHGAYVIDPSRPRATPIIEGTLQTETVMAIEEGRPGEVWIGSLRQGIFVVDATTLRTRRIRHDPMLPESLADDSVTALYKDRSGLLWVGTERAISVYDPGQDAILTIPGASSRPGGLSDDSVWGMAQMHDGQLWLGLEANGVDIVDPLGVRTGGLRPGPQRLKTALPASQILSFAQDTLGNVFTGTEEGLYRVDPKAHQTTRLTPKGRDPTATAQALLHRGQVLWVGGFDGLWQVDATAAQVHTDPPAKAVVGLSDKRVNALAPAPGGKLWIGTYNGLNRFDPATGVVEHIVPDVHDPGPPATSMVTALATDHKGRLWAGTSNGIDVLEDLEPNGRARFHHLGIAQGLVNENIDMLLVDARGQVWASTDDGLALIDPDTFKIRALQSAEGVELPDYWVGVGTLTNAGELLFGGLGGMTVVRPDRLQPWTYQPPVVVTDVHLGGKWTASSRLNATGSAQQGLTVSPEANNLAVEFASLDYSAPARARYAYKLEGFDKDWIETDSAHRVAAYTNLPPGDYLLDLKGSNRDGVWTGAILTVPVHVLPAWFQTLTVKALAAVVLLALLVLTYRLRIRQIAARLQERHHTRLAERDRIARELHDTLLQSTEGLILKMHSVVQQMPQEDPSREVLNRALDSASELANQGRERIYGLREGVRPHAEIGHVLETAAREMLRGSGIAFELKIEGRLRPLRPYIWEELYRIGHEALWNACRHAHPRHITVYVSYGDRDLAVVIGDDGCGIAPEVLQCENGGHFGLAGIRERAQGIKARLSIDSNAGRGTRVEVRINSLLSYAN